MDHVTSTNLKHPCIAVAKLHGGFAAGQFVLGILELNDLASSPICNSVCKKLHGHGRKQASPFKLSELEVLHQVLSDVSQDRWDRLMAGMIFLPFHVLVHVWFTNDIVSFISFWLRRIFMA